MKYVQTLVFVLAALLTVVASNNVQAAYKGDMLYWEDMEDYHADYWEEKVDPDTHEKNWIEIYDDDLQSITYSQQNTNLTGNDPYLNDWSIYSANTFRDYTLTLKAKCSESLKSNPGAEMGVIFHYQNENNYYYINLSSEADSTVFVKKSAGRYEVLARCASPIVVNNDYIPVTIKTIGGKLTIMANDVVIFQVYDNTFTWGKIGVGVKDDTAYFDDIVICKLVELDVEFYQDFNDNALTGWTADHEERWSTSFRDRTSYSLYLHTNEWNYWNRSALGEIMTLDQIEAKDFKFECDIKTVSGDTARDLAMVFCYYDESNYYAAIFHHSKGGSRILRVKNGNTSILAQYSGRCLEDFEWHEATIIAEDNHYKVYYDAVKIMEITDTQLVVGKVGFGSLNNTGYFDNVTVEGEGIDQQKITLGSPNGTEVLKAGNVHRINWISDHISNNIALEYTLDNGNTWTPIITSLLNEYEYNWIVPNVNSTKCRVRVKDVDEYPVDESDRVFTIVPSGSIVVTSPKSGDVYYSEDPIKIQWSASNTSGLVDIEFSSNGGSTWVHVCQDAEDRGTYTWPAPNIESKNCLIRVSDADGFPVGESQPFTIYQFPTGASIIQPIAESPDVAPGDDIWIAVHVGEENRPVQNLFGASYNFNYAPMQYLTVKEIKVGDFLGTTSEIIHFETDNGTGTVSAGITRKNGEGGKSGHGDLLKVLFHVDENTPDDLELLFTLSDINANTEAGDDVDLRAKELVLPVFSGFCVWSGDTNNDGLVNQADVLPIGQYWSLTGPKRDPISILWQEWKCPKGWVPEAAAYADCNGNGAIEASDILAIGLNWGKTHNVALAKTNGIAGAETAASSMMLMCQGEGTDQNPFYVDIQVKDVTDLLGVSFNLYAKENADYVIFDTVQYSEFFGSDLITFESIDNEKSTVSVGATRKSTDGGIDGTGSICRVYFSISEDAPLMSVISFEVSDLTASDSQGGSVALDSETTSIMTGVAGQAELPTTFTLDQNYPNPFNPTTKIGYSVPAEMHVTLRVYNTLGQVVKTLVNSQMAPGRYTIAWDGTSDSGLQVSPGIYLARLHNSEKDVQLIKMVFAK